VPLWVPLSPPDPGLSRSATLTCCRDVPLLASHWPSGCCIAPRRPSGATPHGSWKRGDIESWKRERDHRWDKIGGHGNSRGELLLFYLALAILHYNSEQSLSNFCIQTFQTPNTKITAGTKAYNFGSSTHIKILDDARIWTWLGYMKVAVSIDSVSSVILQYFYQFWDVKLNKQSFRFEIHKYMILYNMYYISQLTFNPFLLLCKILHNSRSNLPSYYCFPWLQRNVCLWLIQWFIQIWALVKISERSNAWSTTSQTCSPRLVLL